MKANQFAIGARFHNAASALAWLFMISTAVGCGNSVVSNRSEAPKDSPKQAEASVAPEEFPIGSTMNLTDAELSNISARVSYLTRFVNSIVTPAINAAVGYCTTAVGINNKLKSDLAASNAEVAAFQAKKDALNKLIAGEVADIQKSQDALAALVGKVAALNTAIANIGPNLKIKLAQINRDFASQISTKQASLVAVRKQMEEVLEVVPFKLDRYLALDKQEDQLIVDIANLQVTLAEQVKILTNSAGQSLDDLKKQLAQAQSDLASKGPAIRASIAGAQRDLARLRIELSEVNKEIQNAGVAAKFVLPTIPSSCGLLGIK